jgi:hypothetical protein
VTENGPVRSTTNYVLDIQITGINDYAPLFLFSPYTVYVNEDKQPGSIIFNPIPYDFDKGDDGATTSVILGKIGFFPAIFEKNRQKIMDIDITMPLLLEYGHVKKDLRYPEKE